MADYSTAVLTLTSLIEQSAALGLDVDRIAIAGDSAGGQLAIATALAAADLGIALRHLALLYPLIDPACASESAMRYGEGFMLTRSFLTWVWDLYGSHLQDRTDVRFDVMRADFDRLPPTTIVTAEYDPLRDEGELFASRLAENGHPVSLHRFDGMIHGFAGFPHLTPCADDAIDLLAAACRTALK